jgi:hypothetical protein
MTTLKPILEVDHIRKAFAGKCGYCPGSVAIKAEVKRKGLQKAIQGVSVDRSSVRYTDKRDGSRYLFPTPLMLQAFLVQYDLAMQEGLPLDKFIAGFAPFRFTLNHPLQVTPVIKRNGGPRPKKSLKVTTDSKGEIQRAPTVIGGVPFPLLATKNRKHGSRGYVEAVKRAFPGGVPIQSEIS